MYFWMTYPKLTPSVFICSTRHMGDTKPHMQAGKNDHYTTLCARAAEYLQCATKHNVKSDRKQSTAVSTCVYFAANHVFTLRFIETT